MSAQEYLMCTPPIPSNLPIIPLPKVFCVILFLNIEKDLLLPKISVKQVRRQKIFLALSFTNLYNTTDLFFPVYYIQYCIQLEMNEILKRVHLIEVLHSLLAIY